MIITASPEQQAIIDYPLAPLRIAAGAGTGKTTTMALRLAGLIEGEGIEPEQALGVTFTNKAAEELADRLRRYLPHLTAEGREIEVTTYHGFAHSLLREFGAVVGVERNAPIITHGYSRQLLRDALAAGQYEHIDVSAPGNRVAEMATLMSQISDHLTSPRVLLSEPSQPGNGVEAKRHELAAALVSYEALKDRLGVVDYGDLIVRAHRLVSAHPDIARRIRERYRVVLLDEYQDTNAAQRLMLQALFGDGFPVTAVGDADQTIYEWRGASLENFAGFPDHFTDAAGRPAATLPLTTNRRSGQRIIDVANRVREHIGGTAAIDELRAAPGAGPGSLHVGWFRTAVEEATWIATEIRRLHDEEDVAFSDIGVLFRKNRQIPLVRDALEAEEIPVDVVSIGGLLFVPEVADLHAWLRVLGTPEDTTALVRVLLGAHFRLGLGDLVPLAEWVRSKVSTANDEEAATIGWAMIEAIDELETVEGLSAAAHGRLGEFRSIHRRLLEAAQGVTLVELCRRILDELSVWTEIDGMGEAARLSARLNLYRFLDLAEAWSPLEGRPSLDAFLEYLDLLADEDTADQLDTARVGGQEAVALITVHRAKGLEWDTVFLPSLCSGIFPADSRRLDDPIERAQALPFRLRLDRADEELPTVRKKRRDYLRRRHQDQEWRTAYVAVTRAAARLYGTGAFWYSTGKPRRQSELFEILSSDDGAVVERHVDLAGPPPTLLRIEGLEGAPDPLFSEGWQAALRTTADDPGWPRRAGGVRGGAYDEAVKQLRMTLEGIPDAPDATQVDPGFKTSVTGLVTYASCPQRFYWSEVDPLPRRPAAWLRRGVEVHRRIEMHNRGVVPLDEAAAVEYDIVFGESAGTDDPYEVFTSSRFADQRPAFVEVPFSLRVDGALVRGRIDAIYVHDDDHWEVIDFKSGRRPTEPVQLVQLQAYAMAVRDAGLAARFPAALTVTFVYLGGGNIEEVSYDVDGEWMREADAAVSALVAAARDERYEPTPSNACEQCDFVQFCQAGTSFMTGRAGPGGAPPRSEPVD